MSDFLALFTEALEEKQNPEYALKMSAYMKGHFEFFGIQAPVRKEIIREIVSIHGWPQGDELLTLVNDMWALPQREYQHLAMDLFRRQEKKLNAHDFELLQHLITTKSWWDTVDFIASNMVGTYFRKFPEHKLPYTEKWMNSGNMWLQRSAIIFQLKYKNDTDEDLLMEYILRCAESKEFFIQKAIGWALRQYAKFQPDIVRRFVENNELKPLSKREALKAFK